MNGITQNRHAVRKHTAHRLENREAGIAVLGIVANGIAVVRLRGGRWLNEKVVSWHLLEDVLGWVAVFVGAVVLLVWNVPLVDPILSVLIRLVVLFNVLKNLKKVFTVFLQRAPHDFDVHSFCSQLKTVHDVTDVHHTHTWTIDGEHHVLTTHIVVNPQASRERIAEIKNRIRSMLPVEHFEHVTIDVVLEGERCSSAACQHAH